MKKTKSLNIIKMIKEGLNQFAKALKIKPHLLYIILGLLAVILISLGLGTRKDGFTGMKSAASSTIKAVDDMNAVIKSLYWTSQSDKETFIKNINIFYSKKMQFLTQGDPAINTFDKAGAPSINFKTTPPTIIPNPKPDGLVYKLNKEHDISGNSLPRYVDDDIVPDQDKYTLETTIANPIKQTDLDAVEKAINDQIKLFSVTEQTKLTDAFKALSKNVDDIHKFMTIAFSENGTINPSYLEEGVDLSHLDPDNILSSSMKTETAASATVKAATALALARAGSESSAASASSEWDKKYGKAYGQAYGLGYKQGYGQGYVQSHSYGQGQPGVFDTYRLADTYKSSNSNVPPGSEDLYMLKTKAVPPSNPPGAANYSSDSRINDSGSNTRGSDTRGSDTKGSGSDTRGSNKGFGTSPDLDAYNTVNPSPTQNSCKPAVVPPCPPCERCPEPSFDCKRVPNYNSAALNQYLPQPVLADFSQFGM
jgi:hypothetical protein